MWINDGTITTSLEPGWNIQNVGELIKNESFTIGGRYSVKVWGFFEAWSIPVNNIPSSDAMQINEWWQKQTELTFFIDADSYSVYINNPEPPFTNVSKPYHDEIEGNLIIQQR